MLSGERPFTDACKQCVTSFADNA